MSASGFLARCSMGCEGCLRDMQMSPALRVLWSSKFQFPVQWQESLAHESPIWRAWEPDLWG